MAPLERVTVMITLIRQLEDVMARENQALKAMQMEEVEALQDDKSLLTEAYEIEMRKLRSDPAILGSLDDNVRSTLDDAIRSLQATSRRNANTLEAAKTVIERLVQRLSDSIAKSSPGRNYGLASGTQFAGQTSGKVIAVAFNHAV